MGLAAIQLCRTVYKNITILVTAGKRVLVHVYALHQNGISVQAVRRSWLCAGNMELIWPSTTKPQTLLQWSCRQPAIKVMHAFDENQSFPTRSACADIVGVDVIIDPVGASYWHKHSQCVAVDGRVLHIGFVSGT